MSPFFSMIGGPIARDVNSFVARKKRDALIMSIIGLLMLTAYALGITALTIYAAQTFGAVAAALLCAAGLFLAAMVLLVILTIIHHREKKQARTKSSLAGTALLSLAPYLVRSNTRFALIAALGLGFATAFMTQHNDE